MQKDVFIAGFGGQGVLLAGNVIAYAAILDGLNASFFPAYGVEKRGGAAMCTVVVTDGDVGSPVVGNPSVAILLNQLSYDRYAPRVRQGGLCILNSSLVEPAASPSATTISIPMNRIAMDLGDQRLVNMVAIGAYASAGGAVRTDTIEAALRGVLPERNHRLIPLNLRAIEEGAKAGRFFQSQSKIA